MRDKNGIVIKDKDYLIDSNNNIYRVFIVSNCLYARDIKIPKSSFKLDEKSIDKFEMKIATEREIKKDL